MVQNSLSFIYAGDIIAGQSTDGNVLAWIYDNNGKYIGFTYNGSDYYYIYNFQGDVEAIANSTGAIIARYIYGPWGTVDAVTDNFGNDISGNASNIANINPIRYRGYYYDTETGLYYVSSRYYDPEVGRWISPEPNVDYGEFDEGSEILGYNVYAYCFNNPVNNFDPDGEAVANIVGGVIGGVAGAALGALLAKELGLSGWKKALFIAGVTAAGAALGAFLGPYMAKLGGKIASMTKSVASSFKATVQSARAAIKHSKAVTKLINNASKLKRSKTVMSHLSSRPYTNSTLTIQNIMKTGKPMADSSLKNGLKWVVNGTYNGSSGVWELVVDAKNKYHCPFSV